LNKKIVPVADRENSHQGREFSQAVLPLAVAAFAATDPAESRTECSKSQLSNVSDMALSVVFNEKSFAVKLPPMTTMKQVLDAACASFKVRFCFVILRAAL
jgi:hypothetical protein